MDTSDELLRRKTRLETNTSNAPTSYMCTSKFGDPYRYIETVDLVGYSFSLHYCTMLSHRVLLHLHRRKGTPLKTTLRNFKSILYKRIIYPTSFVGFYVWFVSEYFMNGMSVVHFGNNTHTQLMEVYVENLIHGENSWNNLLKVHRSQWLSCW